MRYAIPVIQGELCPHFGHCEQFVLIDVDSATRQIQDKQLVPSPGHEPGFLPRWLAEQGANVILAGGMGQRAVDIFNQHQVEVVLGVTERNPEKAVLACLNDSLVVGENPCSHDENHVCDH